LRLTFGAAVAAVEGLQAVHCAQQALAAAKHLQALRDDQWVMDEHALQAVSVDQKVAAERA